MAIIKNKIHFRQIMMNKTVCIIQSTGSYQIIINLFRNIKKKKKKTKMSILSLFYVMINLAQRKLRFLFRNIISLFGTVFSSVLNT